MRATPFSIRESALFVLASRLRMWRLLAVCCAVSASWPNRESEAHCVLVCVCVHVCVCVRLKKRTIRRLFESRECLGTRHNAQSWRNNTRTYTQNRILSLVRQRRYVSIPRTEFPARAMHQRRVCVSVSDSHKSTKDSNLLFCSFI